MIVVMGIVMVCQVSVLSLTDEECIRHCRWTLVDIINIPVKMRHGTIIE